MDIQKNMVSTLLEIPGYTIVETFGVVRGISVRSRSLFGQIGAGFQTIFGGNITMFASLCEKTRQEAYELMIKQAEDLGANAIIGMRYDANELMPGVTEILAYGTAAKIIRK